jgi:hypothetical protein
MDATNVGEMDVVSGTDGGVITGTTIPTCQASGTAIATNNGINFFFKGKDGDMHHITGANTSFQKREITHESGAPLPAGCTNLIWSSFDEETSIPSSICRRQIRCRPIHLRCFLKPQKYFYDVRVDFMAIRSH